MQAAIRSMQEFDVDDNAMTIRIPLSIRMRGGRKVVMMPGGEQLPAPTHPRIDTALLKAVARAFRWKGLLENGRFASVSELASSERMNISYVAHVLRLTLLAPDLVEAILDGRQPRTLQLQPLIRGFPVEWDAQMRRFGRP